MEKFDTEIGPARGLVAKKISMAAFDLTRIAPSSRVGKFVENYWLIEWDRGDAPAFQQENLPHPSQHLVLDQHAGSGLFGVQTKRFFYELQGKGRVFGVKFRPGQFFPIWQQSMAALTDQIVTDLAPLKLDLTTLEAQFEALQTPREMADIFDAHFLGLAASTDQKADFAMELVRQIEENAELMRVTDIANQNHISVRQMQRMFDKYVGISPKWVIDRYRMIEAVEAMNVGQERSLTDLAHRLGYFDQAHFNKAFSALLGRTPQQISAMSA